MTMPKRSLTALLMFFCAGELGSENLTLTTTYPPPMGIYKSLMTTGNAYLATISGKVAVAPGAPANLKFFGAGIKADRFYVGAGNTAYMSRSALKGTGAIGLFTNGMERVTMPQLAVGIGITNPSAMGNNSNVRLTVNGFIQVNHQGCVLTAAACVGNNYATVVPGVMSEMNNSGANHYCCPCIGACPSLP